MLKYLKYQTNIYLTRKLGNINLILLAKIETLSLERMELLGEDLLDFTSLANLETIVDLAICHITTRPSSFRPRKID
jgi:Domain of unknown function (DUF4351)